MDAANDPQEPGGAISDSMDDMDDATHSYPLDGGAKCEAFAVFFSGVRGWGRLADTVAARLQEAGIPVVGIDSKRYFKNSRSPGCVAGELAHLIAATREVWGGERIILVGHRFGAGVWPVVGRALPEAVRERVQHLVLISLPRRVELRFRWLGWLGFPVPESKGQAVLPAINDLADMRISCFTGEDETKGLGQLVPESLARRHFLPGGSDFDGNYEVLASRILAALEEPQVPEAPAPEQPGEFIDDDRFDDIW